MNFDQAISPSNCLFLSDVLSFLCSFLCCIVLDANELEIVQVNGLEPIVQVGRVEVVVWSR